MSEILLVICSLLGVIGLIFLTYYATKWLNKKFRSGGYYGGTNGIKIIECMGIAQDKQLIAVKVGKKAFLLGVTAASVTKLADLDDDDLEAMKPPVSENKDGMSFAESLKTAVANTLGHGKDNNSQDTQNH